MHPALGLMLVRFVEYGLGSAGVRVSSRILPSPPFFGDGKALGWLHSRIAPSLSCVLLSSQCSAPAKAEKNLLRKWGPAPRVRFSTDHVLDFGSTAWWSCGLTPSTSNSSASTGGSP